MSWLTAGNLFGATRVRQPGFCVDGISAMIAGSFASLPGQKGHVESKRNVGAVRLNGRGPSRGLRPRSGAMMTHPSVVGSRRNSLIATLHAGSCISVDAPHTDPHRLSPTYDLSAIIHHSAPV